MIKNITVIGAGSTGHAVAAVMSMRGFRVTFHGDQRFGKDIIGFLAEDVNEIYPIACNLKNGEPEVPEYNMLIAPMLKLIQEQHEEIESLKHRVTILEQKV